MSTTTPRARTAERSQWRQLFSRQNWVHTVFGGYVPMIVALLLVASPLIWMLLSSLKPAAEIVTSTPSLLPENPTLQNYLDVADSLPLGRMLFNSVATTGVGTAIKVFLAITTAYAVVFIDFKYRNVVFILMLVALMVPQEVSIIPNYMTIAALGGRNTLWGIVLPSLGTAFGTFLLRQQFLALPRSLLEAAELDGAGHWRRLWQIVVPVTVPTIATIGLVTLVGEWNSFLWPLIITDDPENMTLPVGLNLLKSAESSTALYGTLMAGAAIIIVPVLIVFALLQRYIVAGLTQGAVKQ